MDGAKSYGRTGEEGRGGLGFRSLGSDYPDHVTGAVEAMVMVRIATAFDAVESGDGTQLVTNVGQEAGRKYRHA